MLSNYISWIVFGALSGWIISQVIPPKTSTESVFNILIGMAGAFFTGLILQVFIRTPLAGFNVAALILTTFVSVTLLATLRNFVKN